jgi:hypothetical protein
VTLYARVHDGTGRASGVRPQQRRLVPVGHARTRDRGRDRARRLDVPCLHASVLLERRHRLSLGHRRAGRPRAQPRGHRRTRVHGQGQPFAPRPGPARLPRPVRRGVDPARARCSDPRGRRRRCRLAAADDTRRPRALRGRMARARLTGHDARLRPGAPGRRVGCVPRGRSARARSPPESLPTARRKSWGSRTSSPRRRMSTRRSQGPWRPFAGRPRAWPWSGTRAASRLRERDGRVSRHEESSGSGSASPEARLHG